jgi:diadenosine tetraphosphate (Ap4A) HIT family hydrolase
MFQLHPRLAGDTLPVNTLELSAVRLMNDCRFPWVILVPRREHAVELHRLAPADRALLIAESGRVATVLERLFAPDKINLGALGNLVPQLHWHVVVRHRTDPCWPGPVWGCGTPEPYGGDSGEKRAALIREALS